mmetsp:Transcript_22859/g.53479  ORF Transcript_22859/g.53479 Transcript_22859/m.53479 type:complete len:241 (-) Transcript_22859:1711-2433(-)
MCLHYRCQRIPRLQRLLQSPRLRPRRRLLRLQQQRELRQLKTLKNPKRRPRSKGSLQRSSEIKWRKSGKKAGVLAKPGNLAKARSEEGEVAVPAVTEEEGETEVHPPKRRTKTKAETGAQGPVDEDTEAAPDGEVGAKPRTGIAIEARTKTEIEIEIGTETETGTRIAIVIATEIEIAAETGTETRRIDGAAPTMGVLLARVAQWQRSRQPRLRNLQWPRKSLSQRRKPSLPLFSRHLLR